MSATGAFRRQLHKVYAWYAGGFAVFVLFVALLERLGLSDRWVGLVFLLVTVALYAGIGVMSRTSDATEYYVAGRRVPAMYNGMATAADWMSAASFLGLAGTLYLQGFGALAFVMGWTGGYCLVALLLAPYLRKFGQYTIPDFLGARYGGHAARAVGIVAAIVCSFTYLVAQILGVGVITSYLTGLEFTIGVFVGLGGVLVCSFLGGMRAVTWTQVAQFIILIVAYLLPVVWLSVKQTGVPVPQLVYGAQLAKVTALEQQLVDHAPVGQGHVGQQPVVGVGALGVVAEVDLLALHDAAVEVAGLRPEALGISGDLGGVDQQVAHPVAGIEQHGVTVDDPLHHRIGGAALVAVAAGQAQAQPHRQAHQRHQCPSSPRHGGPQHAGLADPGEPRSPAP